MPAKNRLALAGRKETRDGGHVTTGKGSIVTCIRSSFPALPNVKNSDEIPQIGRKAGNSGLNWQDRGNSRKLWPARLAAIQKLSTLITASHGCKEKIQVLAALPAFRSEKITLVSSRPHLFSLPHGSVISEISARPSGSWQKRGWG